MNYKKFLRAANAAVVIVTIILALAPGAPAASKFETLIAFGSPGTEGLDPFGDLIFDQAGNLYGTTAFGTDEGMVFELTPTVDGSWTESVLYGFTDGGAPHAGVIFDQAGNLYGTAMGGGAYREGSVFELTKNLDGTWTESALHSFCRYRHSCHDGNEPYAGLIFDTAGNLYGTTTTGGNLSDCAPNGCGVVFQLTPSPDGSWTEKVLHQFTGGKDGGGPYAGLIFDTAGNLYGTATSGGVYGSGVIFKLTPSVSGRWTEKVLHHFTGGRDGGYPYAGLIFDQAGNLYGTTVGGGAHGWGTVFELEHNPNGSWKEKVLHSFNGKDGEWPEGSLIFDQAGNVYGTTFGGGNLTCTTGNGCGVVFKLTPNANGGWREIVLHVFTAHKDGRYPAAGLILDQAGNLYGTSSGYGGDPINYGSVFGITP
jgi:uncharacterized repeat protein (TIGR03803 family)